LSFSLTIAAGSANTLLSIHSHTCDKWQRSWYERYHTLIHGIFNKKLPSLSLKIKARPSTYFLVSLVSAGTVRRGRMYQAEHRHKSKCHNVESLDTIEHSKEQHVPRVQS
jgi:hypothetical protein